LIGLLILDIADTPHRPVEDRHPDQRKEIETFETHVTDWESDTKNEFGAKGRNFGLRDDDRFRLTQS